MDHMLSLISLTLLTLHACTLHGCIQDEVGRCGACMSACMPAKYERVVMPMHGSAGDEEMTMHDSSGDAKMGR